MSRPHALLITRNFPPLVGGMERLFWHAYREIGEAFVPTVVGPRGCSDAMPSEEQAYECPESPAYRFLACSLLKSLRAAAGTRFDICVSASGLTAPVAYFAARYRRVPCVTLVHGLDLIANSVVYQRLFVPFIKRCDLVIANSRNTARLAIERGVNPGRVAVLNPGVQLAPAPSKTSEFRQRYGVDNGPILLSVGRLIPRKGLPEFIRFALPGVVKAHPDVSLMVIGEEATHAFKRAHGELLRIQAAIAETGLERHVRLLGRVDDEPLESAYLDSDVFVFPVLDRPGDVEGFGMVAIEAAAHGLPTAAFSSGGVPDAVEPGRSGILIQSGDYAALAEAINGILSGHANGISADSCRAYAAQFSWEHYGNRMRQLCIDLVQRRNSNRGPSPPFAR